MPTRRTFLSRSAGLLSSLAVADPLLQTSVSAADENVDPDLVQLRPDVEPIVRLIEETPRGQCFEMMASQLRSGLPYRQFLAALYLAGLRNVSPQPPGFKFHCVFVIHAAHQMSLDARVEDRLLPLFWALDNFKASQAQDVREGDFQLRPVRGKLPSGDIAWSEFHAAMNAWDEERADRAITALVRTSSAHQLIESLWQYGARDYRNIGHKAIFVANTWRTLQAIGWRHAEPALRSLVLGLLDFGPRERVNGFAFEDQSFLLNVELARRSSSSLPTEWTLGTDQAAATKDVLQGMRDGDAAEVSKQAVALLQKRQAGAAEIWDAVHLAAGGANDATTGYFWDPYRDIDQWAPLRVRDGRRARDATAHVVAGYRVDVSFSELHVDSKSRAERDRHHCSRGSGHQSRDQHGRSIQPDRTGFRCRCTAGNAVGSVSVGRKGLYADGQSIPTPQGD